MVPTRKDNDFFIVGPDLALYTGPTMSFVRRLACASVAERSAVYVRPDFNYRGPLSGLSHFRFQLRLHFQKHAEYVTDTESKNGKLTFPWNLPKN